MKIDIISMILGILIGGVLGSLFIEIIRKKRIKKILQEAQKKAINKLKTASQKAESIKKEKILQTKQKFLELKTKHDTFIAQRKNEIREIERNVKYKENRANQLLQNNKQKSEWLDKKNKDVDYRIEILNKKNEIIEKRNKEQIEKLEKISGLSSEKAKKELMLSLKQEMQTELMAYKQSTLEEIKINAEQESKKIIISTIQRIGVEQSIENCVSVFNIESDEVKGRIIGREGRNIRSMEAATGVEIIVDDTPDAIILSCFDPIRREIARLALHNLVTDGRIHPARIEEVVAKMRGKLSKEIIQIGQSTVIDLGIRGLHPELVKMVGRMKFRSSYGQNLLRHSREVANLCSLMASELGLDPKIAKRAGLLHDMGKVPEEKNELPHAILGMQWAEKYGENKIVCNAIGAHHDEVEMKSLYAPIVQVCDAISGARPGARRQVLDSYIQRLKEMEELAFSFNGVEKAYAIQAGRELRVIVESSKVNDEKAKQLSFEISQKIQEEMTYPGQIKVTVIRETRAVNVAV